MPRSVTIIATSLFAKQVRLVHMYPSPLAHDVATGGGGERKDLRVCTSLVGEVRMESVSVHLWLADVWVKATLTVYRRLIHG